MCQAFTGVEQALRWRREPVPCKARRGSVGVCRDVSSRTLSCVVIVQSRLLGRGRQAGVGPGGVRPCFFCPGRACSPAPAVVPAAGRQPQQQKLAIRGLAGWVRLRGTLQVRPCKLGRRIHAAHAPSTGPTPPSTVSRELSERRSALVGADRWSALGRSRHSRATPCVDEFIRCLTDFIHAWRGSTGRALTPDEYRYLTDVPTNGRHPPTATGQLSEAGRCGWAGPLAPWMAPSSPHGWVYGVS